MIFENRAIILVWNSCISHTLVCKDRVNSNQESVRNLAITLYNKSKWEDKDINLLQQRGVLWVNNTNWDQGIFFREV